VLNVWASWCTPCQQETPALAAVYQQVKSQVQFLGVDEEDRADSALDFAAHVRPAMKYPSVVDDDKAVLLRLAGPVTVPCTLFVDADGHVVKLVIKAYTSAAELKSDLKRYLAVDA
jgi:thiol-disulfide isomerase/thioredoxin